MIPITAVDRTLSSGVSHLSFSIMDTNDVHHQLLEAPLAVHDDDIKDDKNNLKKIQRLFKINRSSHSNENDHTRTDNYHQRFYCRRKSSSIAAPNSTLHLTEIKSNARIVRIRLVFIHIGEIDTLNEKYQADVYYEARWREKRMNLDTLTLTSQEQKQLLYENTTVRINEFNSTLHWSPQLFIVNAIGQMGEQDKWFTIKKTIPKSVEASSPLFVDVDICEHRRIKGVFWEKLELNHFPVDMQDLTISIASHHHVEHCILIQDEQLRSTINREAFSDQQEWSLYEHVTTEMRETKVEYSFEDENTVIEQKTNPVLAVTCRAARQPGYYYWNGFCLIFLITVCSFCIFSIPPDSPQSRLQVTCTLLLTSVTFRWVVNRSLPQISYLTTLDVYAIISIVILVILCIWHSVIASFIIVNPITKKAIEPTDAYVIIDRYVFIGMFIIYIIIHIALIIWLIFVPYKRRREMEYLDRQYLAEKHIQSGYEPKQDLVFRRSSLPLGILTKMKTVQPKKRSAGVMSNASSFFPIQEETNESTARALDIVELREQDDEYYDHKDDKKRSNKNIRVEQF